MSDKQYWEYEIELALNRKTKKGDWADNYCDEVLKDAGEVMKLIDSQGHSGMYYSLLVNYLERLLNEIPLSPLTDNNSEWSKWEYTNGKKDNRQNLRRPSVFQYADGSIKDNDRVITYFAEDTIPCRTGSDGRIIDKLFPISLPYMPERKPYKLYAHRELIEDINGNSYKGVEVYDYIITPSGEKVEVPEDLKEHSFIGGYDEFPYSKKCEKA